MANATTREDAPFFSPEDVKLIRETIVPQATELEFQTLMRVASIRRLNPLLGQIHFVKRSMKDGDRYVDKWAFQVGIGGFRLIAQRTGEWEGEDEPEYELDPKSGDVVSCKVRIYRRGYRPITGIAYFKEFAQYKSGGGLTKMWQDKPRLMLAKCAASDGYRKGFPEETSDFYEEAEISRNEAGAVARVGATVGMAKPAQEEMRGEVVPPARPGTAAPPQLVESTALCQSFLEELRAAPLVEKAQRTEITGRISAAVQAGKLTEEHRGVLMETYTARLKAI